MSKRAPDVWKEIDGSLEDIEAMVDVAIQNLDKEPIVSTMLVDARKRLREIRAKER